MATTGFAAKVPSDDNWRLHRGSAAGRAESLRRSVISLFPLFGEAVPHRNSAKTARGIASQPEGLMRDGKPEAFRTAGGKAARMASQTFAAKPCSAIPGALPTA